MKNKFISLLTALLACTSVAAQKIIVMESPKYLKCNDTIRVYSPEGKEVKATLILLHGWSGSYKDWGDKMNLQEISNQSRFRIITPDGFYNSWYVNNTDTSKMQMRDFMNKEMLPYLFETYGLMPESTFITGLSMGGHGAVNLFIDNHDKFRAAGSMSGVLSLPATTLKKELEKVFGDSIEKRMVEESATTRAKLIAGTGKVILVSCGYSDYYFPCSVEFEQVCQTLGIPVIRTDSPGTHSWKFWEFALSQHIWYFTRILEGLEMGTPHKL